MENETVGYCIDLTEEECREIIKALRQAVELVQLRKTVDSCLDTLIKLYRDYLDIYEMFDN